jgi:two-component system cell cycle sensor histidine kinase/response regulator CckA
MPYTGIVSHTQKLQSLGQLAGGVAHDFNNILSIVEGYARMIERQLGPHHPAQEKLQHILIATKRGASLTRRLLAFGRQNLMMDTCCDLVHVVRECEILLQPLVSKKVEIYKHLPDYPLYVPCDSDILSQILLNLAVNARDAMRDNGSLWLHVSEDEPDKVILSVTDNGMGIAEDILPRIFEPFYTTKPQGQGTGLGLSMIAGFMQQMQGDISVESKLGHGTKFILTFPRQPTPASVQTETKTSSTEKLRQKTVLIVDDEESLLPILEAQLQELGLKVLKAANAEAALVVQEDYPEPIDLLLTDIVMPGIDGGHLAELFTSIRPETGVVYMTGHATRGTDIGQEHHLPKNALVLPKPFAPDSLSPALEAALARVQHIGSED